MLLTQNADNACDDNKTALLVFYVSDCSGLEYMEEYLNENYRVKIDDMNITVEEGTIYYNQHSVNSHSQ